MGSANLGREDGDYTKVVADEVVSKGGILHIKSQEAFLMSWIWNVRGGDSWTAPRFWPGHQEEALCSALMILVQC